MFDHHALSQKLGVAFVRPALLQQALTHRSYINEHPRYELDHNERLEFLGDAVLELVVTDYLYHAYDNPEGELTAWRAALVNGEMLAKIALDLGINDALLMSKGEAKDTGRARQYLLANAFEAIIGAIYLDQGYVSAKDFVMRHVVVHIDQVLEQKLYRDPKSHFQEQAQEQAGITPRYDVLEESGPDHDKYFRVGVFLEQEMVAEGTGKSKQEAQREAARKALEVKKWA